MPASEVIVREIKEEIAEPEILDPEDPPWALLRAAPENPSLASEARCGLQRQWELQAGHIWREPSRHIRAANSKHSMFHVEILTIETGGAIESGAPEAESLRTASALSKPCSGVKPSPEICGLRQGSEYLTSTPDLISQREPWWRQCSEERENRESRSLGKGQVEPSRILSEGKSEGHKSPTDPAPPHNGTRSRGDNVMDEDLAENQPQGGLVIGKGGGVLPRSSKRDGSLQPRNQTTVRIKKKKYWNLGKNKQPNTTETWEKVKCFQKSSLI
ncbi:hypothetical protein E2320_014466 [Naja naja]|nr:hypothetical protein E2320_014466 [Naja naja]